MLDDGQIEQYRRDGFLVIEGFVDRVACDELKAAANQIVAEFQPSGQRTIFTTNEQERASNAEFLASGVRRPRRAAHVERAEHQQDRSRHA